MFLNLIDIWRGNKQIWKKSKELYIGYEITSFQIIIYFYPSITKYIEYCLAFSCKNYQSTSNYMKIKVKKSLKLPILCYRISYLSVLLLNIRNNFQWDLTQDYCLEAGSLKNYFITLFSWCTKSYELINYLIRRLVFYRDIFLSFQIITCQNNYSNIQSLFLLQKRSESFLYHNMILLLCMLNYRLMFLLSHRLPVFQ